jgi:hypothetical protein
MAALCDEGAKGGKKKMPASANEGKVTDVVNGMLVNF